MAQPKKYDSIAEIVEELIRHGPNIGGLQLITIYLYRSQWSQGIR